MKPLAEPSAFSGWLRWTKIVSISRDDLAELRYGTERWLRAPANHGSRMAPRGLLLRFEGRLLVIETAILTLGDVS